jgi:hypothetical protein
LSVAAAAAAPNRSTLRIAITRSRRSAQRVERRSIAAMRAATLLAVERAPERRLARPVARA